MEGGFLVDTGGWFLGGGEVVVLFGVEYGGRQVWEGG